MSDLVEKLRRLSERRAGGAKAGERRAALREAAAHIEELEALGRDWKDLQFEDWRGLIRAWEERAEAECAARKEAQRQHDRLWHQHAELKGRAKALELVAHLVSMGRAAPSWDALPPDWGEQLDRALAALNVGGTP